MARNTACIPIILALAFLGASGLSAHCQIPCGIYDDENRFASMLEDVATIEKAMNRILELSAQDKANWNQLVRWVMNKEEHADRLTETVTFYFMAQRVKPADPGDEKAYHKYLKEITLLHRIMVHAMKAKQSTDLEQVATLRRLIGEFKASYLD